MRLAAAAALAAGLAASAAAAVPEPPFESSSTLVARTWRYDLYEVRFPSPSPTPFPPNRTVWGRLYLPRSAARGALPPAVLLLPIMAAPNDWIETRFAHALVNDGIAALVLEMPFQHHRRPDPNMLSGQVFLARTAAGLARNFRQSTADARRALSWLERSGLVDGSRLGLFGISLGGIVSSAVYSTDERPKAAVLMLAGADFPDLVLRGEMTAEFAAKARIRADELRTQWQGLDPLERAASNAGKRVLLINARADKVIPRENALRLKEAFPGSRQVWLPFGHYTALLHMVWVPAYASRQMALLLTR